MSGQGQGGSNDNTVAWIIVGGLVIAVVWLIWHFNASEIRDMVRWWRFGEMWLISWVLEGLKLLGLSSGDFLISYRGQNVSWQQGFAAASLFQKEALTYEHMEYFNALTMQPMQYFYIALLGAAALWAMFKGPQTHYRVTLGLEGLIRRQASNFPIISPFVDFNPSTQPPRPPGSDVPAELPAFAEALAPEEWLAYHEIPVPNGVVNAQAAAKAFQKQLLGRWKGSMALQPHEQVLLAAFCLKASRKRKESDVMLGQLAQCWSFKKGLKINRKLLNEARKILRDKKLAGLTLSNCNQHAFVTTAMLRALATARAEGGVLQPAQFVWLRAHDRTLWYPLNNLGRHSFNMEAMGAMAHYKAEKLTQRPIPVPKMEGAIETLTEYMQSRRARPIPKLDYSGSKKRGIKKAV